jgi:hypothetical protein
MLKKKWLSNKVLCKFILMLNFSALKLKKKVLKGKFLKFSPGLLSVEPR